MDPVAPSAPAGPRGPLGPGGPLGPRAPLGPRTPARYMERMNTWRPKQNGRHFADDILKCIFFNENVCISIEIPLKFGPKGPININSTLVQVMAWRLFGAKPSYEPMMNEPGQQTMYASLGLNELTHRGRDKMAAIFLMTFSSAFL